ncbi:cholecystokinin [Mugil cephalus]|uniref:cholecystokinin n=1 Tax=Mugil cephalus TaxID=48193 RepID=UPI001FB5B916|nr:cholecystokinin [Mugil cephalus]
MKVVVVFGLLVALLVSGVISSPETPAAVEAKETNVLRELLAKRDNLRDSAGRQKPGPHSARVERRAHLSEDEREIMTKQIMQAISEMMNSDCMSDRDYQGWVDFGRRDAE